MSEDKATCKHDTWQHAQTSKVDARDMTVTRMEWCGTCGSMLDERTWKIPLPDEVVENGK